jgi:hypothetical protein
MAAAAAAATRLIRHRCRLAPSRSSEAFPSSHLPNRPASTPVGGDHRHDAVFQTLGNENCPTETVDRKSCSKGEFYGLSAKRWPRLPANLRKYKGFFETRKSIRKNAD